MMCVTVRVTEGWGRAE